MQSEASYYRSMSTGTILNLRIFLVLEALNMKCPYITL